MELETSEPEVSVIVPYYNGQNWLPRALASVLNQAGVRLEIIVVDDGSAVSARPVLERFPDSRLHLLSLSHAGKGTAVNHGLQLAKGVFVCVLDQDDEMLPGRLTQQVTALRMDLEYAGVYSDYERRDENGCLLDVYQGRQGTALEMLHGLAIGRAFFSMQTLLLRKSVFRSLAGFSTDMRITGLDDGEFFVRLLASGYRLRYVPGLFGRWFSHSDNFSKGLQFHIARIAFLSNLKTLASEYECVRKELPYFFWSHYFMRGIFHLENDCARQALADFRQAIRARPLKINGYYLYAKSLYRSICKRKDMGS